MENIMKERRVHIATFPSGMQWLNKLPSESTKTQYAYYLKRYCDAVGKTPEELLQLKIEGLKHVGEKTEFQAEDLLESYFLKNKLEPSARLSLRNAVFSFYRWNRRALEKTTASEIKNSLPEAKSRTPTLDDIQALEDKMTTTRDKAINRFIASTALRIGTLQNLYWRDLEETGNGEAPLMLEIEAGRLKGKGAGKYKGLKHIAFVNRWAYEMLLEYKKEAQLKGYMLEENDKVFIAYYQTNREQKKGLTTKGFFQLYERASLKAWKDIEKKKFTPHDFRSFVNSALESAGLNENIIAPLMAHKQKGIAQSYSEHTKKELLESYVKALPWLIPKTVSTLETELKKAEQEHQEEFEEMKEALETYSKQYNKLEAMLKELQKPKGTE